LEQSRRAPTGRQESARALFLFLALGVVTGAAVIGISWLSTMRASVAICAQRTMRERRGRFKVVPFSQAARCCGSPIEAFLMNGKSESTS